MDEKIIIEGKYNYQVDIKKKMKQFLEIVLVCAVTCIFTLIFINGTDVTEPLMYGSISIGILSGIIAIVYIIIYLYC